MTATVEAIAALLPRTDGEWPVPVMARELAAAGVPVFPCVPLGKRPLTGHGFHDATTDLQQIAAWWRQYPAANLAVPTGRLSGLVVVDVDLHGPVDGYRAFERALLAGLVSGWQLLVTTPSGGMHAYYPASPGREQRSWQAARAGIDFRGDGGYIVVPPSTVPINGGTGRYRVRRVNPGASAVLDSVQLREFLDPRPLPSPRPGRQVERSADVSRLSAWVAARSEGERNRGLFWAACRLAENSIPVPEALEVLTAAAARAGLGPREITATIRSAYRTTQPRPQAPSRIHNGSSQAMDGDLSLDAHAAPAPVVRGLS